MIQLRRSYNPCLNRAKKIWKIWKIRSKTHVGSLHSQQKRLHDAVIVDAEGPVKILVKWYTLHRVGEANVEMPLLLHRLAVEAFGIEDISVTHERLQVVQTTAIGEEVDTKRMPQFQ